MTNQILKTDIQNTLDAIKAKGAQQSQQAQFSNVSPMRGRHRDSAKRAQISLDLLDQIEKANQARDKHCLTPLMDLTGKHQFIVSTCASGHSVPRFANCLRVVSISKTGVAHVYSSGLFARGEDPQQHIDKLQTITAKRGYSLEIIDLNNTSGNIGKYTETDIINPHSQNVTCFVTRSKGQKDVFIIWAYNGHKMTPIDYLYTQPSGGPLSDIDFNDAMSAITGKLQNKLGIHLDNLKVRYMGLIGLPV